MKTYQDICDRLDACTTAKDLALYAGDLYACGLLDESEQTTMIGKRGPLAPWLWPEGAELLSDNGEDFVVRLASGNLARWINRDREWSQPENGESEAKGDQEMDDNATLVAEHGVQHDESGVGHCWRPAGDLPANIAEEVACWIIEDDPNPGDEYRATNGQTYRLPAD